MSDKITRRPFRKLVALDLDGVLQSYTTRWSNAATISDGPTPGAIAFIKCLVEDERFDVCIVSSRLADPAGMDAVRIWIRNHIWEVLDERDPRWIFSEIQFSATRPPAHATIDDRGWQFDGTWPDLDAIDALKPWNKRPDLRALTSVTIDVPMVEEAEAMLTSTALEPGAVLPLPQGMRVFSEKTLRGLMAAAWRRAADTEYWLEEAAVADKMRMDLAFLLGQPAEEKSDADPDGGSS